MSSRFLATTRSKLGWPEGGPDVFLGGWCLQFKEDAELYPNAATPPYAWASHEARTDGLQYCADVTARIVRGLTAFFSNLFQCPLDERETRLLAGAAIGRIVIGLRHDFVCLQDAAEKYGPLRTAGIRKEDYVTPATGDMLVDQLRRDVFRIQLMTEMCPLLGIVVEPLAAGEVTTVASPPMPAPIAGRSRGIGGVMRGIVKSLTRWQAGRARTVVYNSTLSIYEVLVLVVGSGFRIGLHPLVRYNSIEWPCPDPVLRRDLADHIRSCLGDLPFERALCKIVPAILPVSLLEGLGILKSIAAKNYPCAPKTILSAYGWNNDDPFRVWAILAHKRGARLVSCQHGGAYGQRYLPGVGEATEISVVDQFISWGGSGQQMRSRVTLPIPPHYLVERSGGTDELILYIGTAVDRLPFSIAHYPIGPMFFDYLDRQIDFWNSLPGALRSKLLMRPNPGDAGWSEIAQVRRYLPDLKIDDFVTSFADRLRRARVAVVDNLSTTFAQCLGSGVPTILVWDPDVWTLNEEASVYFAALEKAGVYHRTPRAAAEALGRIWSHPDEWWRSTPVAAAVNNFLDHYVIRSRDWARPWLRELLA